MNWIEELLHGENTAHTVLVLSAVIALGVALGQLKLKGISLGIAGVLFSGLAFGHYGFHVNQEIIEFVRELGLIFFVFTIGMQVGPSFFASLRREGLKLNLLATGIVLGGVAIAYALFRWGGLPLPAVVGLLSGAVTNTPGLGAAQQALKERLPELAGTAEMSGMAYAVAYPFGIIGIILTMILVRLVLRIQPAREAEAFEKEQAPTGGAPGNFNIKMANERLAGCEIRDLAGLVKADFVVSRLLRAGDVMVPDGDTKLAVGDVLHVVCSEANATKLAIIVGDVTREDVRKVPSELVSRTVMLTRKQPVGNTIRELDLLTRYGVAITRVSRAGIELIARADTRLHFGDRVTVVGDAPAIAKVAQELGDSMKQLQHPNLMPIFIGIILGVILGSIPFRVPGVPAPVKLGLAGGPLLVAIVLSRYARIGPIVWYLPQSANLILRELGITLFLAAVGLKSGGKFIATLTQGDGLQWMALASMITVAPLLVAGFVARLVFKVNYLSVCGLLAGSMTDPPALSFANQIASSDAPAVTYASVYAMVMFLRILTAQALVIFLA